jgi:hypothetical protein
MTVGRIPSVEGGIQPTIFDAKADLLTATAADTPARLAVGANGTVLTADSVETTGLKWATPSASTPAFSAITSGTITSGTQLSITGLSSYDNVIVAFTGANCATSGSQLNVRLNTVTTSDYFLLGGHLEIQNTGSTFTSATVGTINGATQNAFRTPTGYLSPGTANSMVINLAGCKSASGFTTGTVSGFYEAYVQTGENTYLRTFGLGLNQALSSIQIFWEDGYTFTGGTYKVYGA